MSSNDITLDIGSRIGLSMEVSQSVSHMSPAPYIGENGNWYVYDNVTGEYVDSGTEARGPKGEDGVQIDDEHVSDETVWSSYKTNE